MAVMCLTDCWTSIGVVIGLTLAMFTGWLEFDPLVAILVALNILWSGGSLIRRSIGGLMDEVDPAVEAHLKKQLDTLTRQLGLQYHGLRHRSTGNTLWVEFHLLVSSEHGFSIRSRLGDEESKRNWSSSGLGASKYSPIWKPLKTTSRSTVIAISNACQRVETPVCSAQLAGEIPLFPSHFCPTAFSVPLCSLHQTFVASFFVPGK